MFHSHLEDTDNMACFRFIEVLVFFLLLHKIYSEEQEPVFKVEGGIIETGYCFRADYIVVYRSAPEGDQLLCNSSNKNMPYTPPADLQGRTHISEDRKVIGFQISNLTHLDSGIYRRECWNQMIISQKTQQLTVCKEEIKSEEIIVNKEGGQTDLLCKSSAIGFEGTSVLWYHEMYPSYVPTLFLDSSVSLKPLVGELAGLVDVRDNGTLLVFNNMLKKTTYFKCLVIKGKNCLSFQNMYPPDHSESKDIFVSLGDRVVLNCPADGNDQQWETPLGKIDGNSIRDNQMYLSADDFSLVIPAIFDKHTGDYSCISPSLEMQYFLVLCPKNKSQDKVVYQGHNVLLTCNFGQNDSERVHWHRYRLSGQYEFIHDSKDKTIPIPEDLQGRVTVSEDGSLLTIFNLKITDGGKYACAVLKSPDFLVNYSDFNEDYDGKGTGENETSNEYWLNTLTCIFKKEINLTISVKGPSAAFNATTYAVAVGLLVVGVIVTVVVVKKRARASPTQREATLDKKRAMDPGCTERLTQSE